jgi:hypothetical protein
MRSPSCLSSDLLPHYQLHDDRRPATDTPGNHGQAKQQCLLLDLPAEIRNNIYAHIVGKFEEKITNGSGKERQAATVKGIFAQLPQSIRGLLRTCKTIYLELLSLLFGSYTWTADLLLRHSPPGKIGIRSKGSWLLAPSTVLYPTSNNIRRVNFRIKETISPSVKKCCIQFTIEIRLGDRTGTDAYTIHVSGITIKGNYHESLLGRTLSMKQTLERSIETALEEVVKAKRKSRKSVTSFTVEEWQGLALQLKSAYMTWFAEANMAEEGLPAQGSLDGDAIT